MHEARLSGLGKGPETHPEAALKMAAYCASAFPKKLSNAVLVKYWKRFRREVVDAPSLETFKVRLNRTLSSLI